MGRYEIKPSIYKKFIKKNNCICTNNKLENNVLYVFF